MGILEYDLKKASLEAEIKVLNRFYKEYEGDRSHILDELDRRHFQLDTLISSQIPF